MQPGELVQDCVLLPLSTAGCIAGCGDDHRTAYAKAKRFKKLARLLNSPAAKAALVRLRLGCLVMLAFTAVVQLVVFIVDRSFYNSLSA